MGRVYSYLRFSDPKQAAGSSADRQLEYAQRWACERGLVLDESLSMRDEGLSAYHERHVSQGALGVFLRAVEDGHIEAGSVLVVEGLDRLSRAEPLKAQAQLTQIIHAGLTVVTASDGQEYSLEAIKANPYKLIHSLVVMIRAHEESDTKSKRVRAAIRRQCEAWQAGTWRGVIRNGHDPNWVRWNGTAWDVIPERAEALRYAIGQYMAGHGGVSIIRDMDAQGLSFSATNRSNSSSLHLLMRKRILVGDKTLSVDGETYILAGYYPALLSPDEFDALQAIMDKRQRRKGPAEIPSLFTGMGIAVCGYCGGALSTNNLMSRKKQPNGLPWPGHRRLSCTQYSNGHCRESGTIQAAPVELAVMLLCADKMRMAGLMTGGDEGQALRTELATTRGKLTKAQNQLDRLARALAEDDGATPITLLRQMRNLEDETATHRAQIETLERTIAHWRPAPTADLADQWQTLIEGVARLDKTARLKARELVRESLSRIVLWHKGRVDDPDYGAIIEMEMTARGGGSVRVRIDRETGGMLG